MQNEREQTGTAACGTEAQNGFVKAMKRYAIGRQTTLLGLFTALFSYAATPKVPLFSFLFFTLQTSNFVKIYYNVMSKVTKIFFERDRKIDNKNGRILLVNFVYETKFLK